MSSVWTPVFPSFALVVYTLDLMSAKLIRAKVNRNVTAPEIVPSGIDLIHPSAAPITDHGSKFLLKLTVLPPTIRWALRGAHVGGAGDCASAVGGTLMRSIHSINTDCG